MNRKNPKPKTALKRRLFIAFNLFIFIMTAIMVTVTLVFGSVASQKDHLPFAYWQHIITFTILSNIFLGLVALISTIIGTKCFYANKKLPSSLVPWYLVATASAMLTCLTVVFYLTPARAMSGKGIFDMLIGPMFFLHFLDPILSAVAFIFLMDSDYKLTVRDRILATLPPVAYGVVYFIFVAIVKTVPDFYGLTFGGKVYLAALVGLIFAVIIFGISSFISYCHNREIAVK